jgi:hypothetical protein
MGSGGLEPRAAVGNGESPKPADVAAWCTTNELVMFFYGRIHSESLRTEGDRGILDRLHA